ncbi:MAG: glycosyltransferase [Anaerolineae bacterium]|nr:glycosyltransferase [Anaerolineae bacterium]
MSPRILFVHNAPTRFVRLDLDLLQRHYAVTECYLASHRVSPLPLWRQVQRYDLIFGWFASWHTFLPMLFARLLRRPSLLVIGGYDLANMPEIGYGHQRGGLKRLVSRWTMSLAACLVTNAYYSQAEAERNAGIQAHRVQVIYHGLPDPFGSLPTQPREHIALTVGNVDRANLWRKGHEPFVRAAALLPDVQFILVGTWKDKTVDYLRSIATPNVAFTGRVDDATLLDYYRRASVYVQASQHEGFGLSVAEAMLAGCIPVVTGAGALPEVVGPCGVYVPELKAPGLAQAIEEGLAKLDGRQPARVRILENFSLERRDKHLCECIKGLLEVGVCCSR